ncbi:hypothetical protein SAMN04487895_12725 [Paenibacillus sophorae]|uniref:Uncharacterized protein n=1 Tax=Paenibacillus sophorae TaxID=1333845 RepID=A0A1H8VS91_9BACL|nr:hypothetical protein [Paenibacillus sophorae]QWU15680.1 hypothetical protein KP014_28340 [Paenibacillus sophorae]SEP18225.1 hypothetical protein SAMN04487895_12725 [Paenibacillus sophorae]
MTLVMLMVALKQFLETKLADDATTVPTVHLGFLPTKTADNRDDPVYPMIIIRPVEGQGDDKGANAQVKLLFGTQSEDDAGFIDLLNLMERVRILLLRQRIIDNKFQIDPNWKWKFYEQQPLPEWVGEVVTTWDLPQIRQEVKGL